jgi:integrase
MRLTDKVVRDLPVPATGYEITWDDRLPGFGVRVTANDVRSFVLRYRVKGSGKERTLTIGQYGAWAVKAAFERAKELRRQIDTGADPMAEAAALRVAPTVTDLAARFDSEHIEKLSPRTRTEYRAIVANNILPTLGALKVASVSERYELCERLHNDLTKRHGPVLANRVLSVLSKMFSLAIKWRMCTANPCRGITRNAEHQRKRYLSPDELARLTAALNAHDDQDCADVFRLLLLTGARRGEVLTCEWGHIDLAAGLWVKPYGLTKQKAEHRLPLNAQARALLARRHERRNGSRYVFPGRDAGKPRADVKLAWRQICKAAGLADFRVHDLRHAHASFLVSAGYSLPTIGALLGHSQSQTTMRYSHLLDATLREASERLGRIIDGSDDDKVVPMVRGR